ncbi:TRAP transporter permease [Acuticoccus sp. MNP-M23]|uniref:TRAP transporter permease n=1 Tax=Acuticoccus sp. MNP-M23 TaxID=3072793 RepID=UPI0028151C29|nr:TRAP transporter permease [Acuticoccus sp. MNP-M23]WMS44251.1 TRAP transporter permease [Acuticoccus sp. MNP-M23]
MTTATDPHAPGAATSADDLVASVDSGARVPLGWQRMLVPSLAFTWALFQLYVASPLPFIIQEQTGLRVVFNNTEVRAIHLAFALLLVAMAFPLFSRSPRDKIPLYDWVLGIVGAGSCLYLVVFADEIARRSGLPTNTDLIVSTIGMVIVGISVYRALGLPLLIVVGVFLSYVFFGSSEFFPDSIRWAGASYSKAMWHFWMQTEGVFGVALGVSASMIFLFVLFGSILEKAGAGNYFIKLAFSLLGHLRGGPAKASVIASALSGIYSGSSIANVVTTGTFTIPLMKRTGFSPEKAGAIEVAASTNGQLTPPVMGAAAFLIAEFTGTPYTDLIVYALLPALVSYIALLYIVHLESLKLGLKGLPHKSRAGSAAAKIQSFIITLAGIMALGFAVHFGLGWTATAFPDAGLEIAIAVFVAFYIICLVIASKREDLHVDDPDAPIQELPVVRDVLLTGLHFLLPIIVLLYCVMVVRMSPGLAAFWASASMVLIAFTQHPIKALLRGGENFAASFAQGWDEFSRGMISGARNMIPIAVATGAAGIIVGTIALTGAHQVVSAFVEALAGGSLMLMLILVAVMSLILGMGLPTTANYIVVSSLMAPVIVSLGASEGLIIPLVAAHLFVFYFGILADDTPPVGLAAYAAAGISGGDPIKTGLQGFGYDIRTALLPFMFIFNTELLLMKVVIVDGTPTSEFVPWYIGVKAFVIAVIAMLVFAAATQRYFFSRNNWFETVALLLVALTLLRPSILLDMVQPPYDDRAGVEIYDIAGSQPAGSPLRMELVGTDFNNPLERTSKYIVISLDDAATGEDRIADAGLTFLEDGDRLTLDEPFPGTPFAYLGQDYDFYAEEPVVLNKVQTRAERMPKEIFYIPAFIILALVILMQRRRQTQPAF